jgi:hypothetical protein
VLLLNGQTSKSGYLPASALRKRGILVHCRYDLGTLLAGSTARSSSQILRNLRTALIPDGLGIVMVDLDGRAGADDGTNCKQGN